MPRKKNTVANAQAERMRQRRAAETADQKRDRVRKMRDAARKKARLRLRHRRTRKGSNPLPRLQRSAEEKDAMNAGASIVDADTLRRPLFKVITPKGVRFETLEPDLI